MGGLRLSEGGISITGKAEDREVVKGIGLADIASADDWSSKNAKNPDFNLVLIQAANVGFQAKMSAVSGSYLISEFTRNMTQSVVKKDEKTLASVAEDVQNALHERGKQQTINIFNSGTRSLRLCAKKRMPKRKAKRPSMPAVATSPLVDRAKGPAQFLLGRPRGKY